MSSFSRDRSTLQLFRALRYNPIHPSIGYYHLSAVNHTSPVAVYTVYYYILPSKTITLDECNVMCRLLYRDC